MNWISKKWYGLVCMISTMVMLNACIFPLTSQPTPIPNFSTPDQGFLVPTRASTTQDPPRAPTPGLTLASTQAVVAPTQNSVRNNRAGFGLSTRTDAALWASRLGSSWYLDWAVKDIAPSSLPEHWQMIRLSIKSGTLVSIPPQATITKYARMHPGSTWIIGNEPDVIWQDSLTAEVYALAYHDLYTLLKQTDPSARVATAGISQATPLRLAYLDRVLAEYQRLYQAHLPADWWTVHGFVLREEKGSWGVDIPPGFDQLTGQLFEVTDHNRLDLFTQQITRFRQWMAQNGYRDVPLALTEYGILMPPDLGFPPEETANYLKLTFSWLDSANDAQSGYPQDENHLVQRWAWFSLHDTIYPASNLADLDKDQLTLIGKVFQEFTQPSPTPSPATPTP